MLGAVRWISRTFQKSGTRSASRWSMQATVGEFALHSASHKRFVRMVEETVDSKGGEKAANELPRGWDGERFTIVDAGGGLIALHSKNNNRFIKMDGGDANVNGLEWLCTPGRCLAAQLVGLRALRSQAGDCCVISGGWAPAR